MARQARHAILPFILVLLGCNTRAKQCEALRRAANESRAIVDTPGDDAVTNERKAEGLRLQAERLEKLMLPDVDLERSALVVVDRQTASQLEQLARERRAGLVVTTVTSIGAKSDVEAESLRALDLCSAAK